MIDDGLAIKTVNHYCLHIRKLFKLAASNAKIPPDVFAGIATVEALKPGRSRAIVPKRKPAAMVEHVEAILPHVSALVRDMIQIQLLTGMRPGEVCGMRRDQLQWVGETLIYRPGSHKTEHHGKQREIPIGPKAQEFLRPYMNRDVMLPMLPASYRRSINRACKVAGIPKFSPQQIRKAFAEKLRRRNNLEAAQVLLGHSSKRTTEKYYAGSEVESAFDIVKEIG